MGLLEQEKEHDLAEGSRADCRLVFDFDSADVTRTPERTRRSSELEQLRRISRKQALNNSEQQAEEGNDSSHRQTIIKSPLPFYRQPELHVLRIPEFASRLEFDPIETEQVSGDLVEVLHGTLPAPPPARWSNSEPLMLRHVRDSCKIRASRHSARQEMCFVKSKRRILNHHATSRNHQPHNSRKTLLTLLFLVIYELLMLSSKLIRPVDSEPTIEVTKFHVPSRVQLGKPARLFCQYQLKGVTLHAMKLFKDNNEFYRYSPHNRNLQRDETKLIFPIPGVYVDESRSNGTSVLLGTITWQSAGTYKCQVSIEDTFKSVSAERRMDLMGSPTTELSGQNGHSHSNKHPINNNGNNSKGFSATLSREPPKSLVQQQVSQARSHTNAKESIRSNGNSATSSLNHLSQLLLSCIMILVAMTSNIIMI